ncbi:MAG: sulfatase-like hydrolase/transferase [Candidatus Melainabacteria bacterium]|nr:sulfatase-like hydrolase/transferase [Candidatus Melainabacteria bacterium]
MQKLDSRVFSLARKPDIYLFVIESLREDFITALNAPHLKNFKQENVSFPMGLSNANATHIAWFSLCYSQFPFYWGKVDPEEWKGGSTPLRILKKMGYKIHVSSSARLGYFQMDRVIFGEGQHLADSLFAPEEEDVDEPYVRDQKSIDNLLSEMNKEGSGRFFLVFLDATHFDYSWPKEATHFSPYEEKINYFKAAMSSSGVEGIKNRYRNAIHYVDSLFGQFYEALKKSPGGKEAVVVVTGDHGEEFYEQGNLFHASSLTHPQMHIPLYYRFGEKEEFKRRSPCHMSCQMDVFPTLFHYLIGEDLMGDVLQGQSIFKQERWPYTIIARFNAIRNPSEFCIHDGHKKILAEFTDEKDIFNSKGLKIFSTKNCSDENLTNDIDAIQDGFGKAFDRIFPDAR